MIKKDGYDPYSPARLTNQEIAKFANDVFPELYASANSLEFEAQSVIAGNSSIEGKALMHATQSDLDGSYSVKSKGMILIAKFALNSFYQLSSVVGHELNHMTDMVNGSYQAWANKHKDIRAARVLSESIRENICRKNGRSWN